MVTATIKPDSPRRADWIYMFGRDTVFIRHPEPFEHDGPRGKELFLLVAPSEYRPREVRKRVIARMAERWGLAKRDVEEHLDDPRLGLPILAEDVTVTMNHQSAQGDVKP